MGGEVGEGGWRGEGKQEAMPEQSKIGILLDTVVGEHSGQEQHPE